MKSVNTSSERSVDSNVFEPDQGDFLGIIEGLQMTASSRVHSRTDLNRIDETRGNFTVEEGDLLVNEKTLTGKHTLITIPLFHKLSSTMRHRRATSFPLVPKNMIVFHELS